MSIVPAVVELVYPVKVDTDTRAKGLGSDLKPNAKTDRKQEYQDKRSKMIEGNDFKQKKEALCRRMSALLPKLRRTLGLSQTHLGEYVSVSRQTISEIERGEYQMSWNQFASFYLVFGGNQASHDILAENEMGIRDIAPAIAVPPKSDKQKEQGTAQNLEQNV